MSDEPDRAIGYLSSSPVRVDLLERLVDGPVRPADLVDSTDASRTTVHRTLTDFLDREWSRRADGEYVATGLGELALESYRRAQARFRTLERAAPVLAHLDGVDGLDPAWLEGARLETATEANPQRPVEWYADRLTEVDGERLRGMTPVMNRQYMSVHAPLVFDGTATQLIVGESTFEFVAERYSDRLERSIGLEHFDLYATAESPPMGMTLYGETVFLGAYDEGGRITGMIACDDARLREWADRTYRRYRDEARRITADDVDG